MEDEREKQEKAVKAQSHQLIFWDVDMHDLLKQDGLNRQKHKYHRAAEQRMNGGKVGGDMRAAFLPRIIREADTQQPIQKQSTEWASGCS